MWILECDGSTLQNKKIWLRPGKNYLFGRTRKQEGKRNPDFVLSDTSISRQHLTLSVSPVKSGDGSSTSTRPEIILEDQNTTAGTEIDGERVKNQKKVLNRDVHTFKLGRTQQTFRIRRQPVILTYSLSSKDTKKGKDPLIGIRNKLEDLDIKSVIPYITTKTTHVVAKKRNTAKGLQALVNGRYIVGDSFIDALVYSTTPENLDEPESLSPLELDFDAHWPDPLQHLPEEGKEPTHRPIETFAPNAARRNVFEGYTFIFCDRTQFETLQAPITNGGGKALHFGLVHGRTTAEEIIRFVKNAAGEKGMGEFEDGSEGKGVVVVRFFGKGEFSEWALGLCDQVALGLDHRLIQQSEFLDAILINDASGLRRPLLPEDESNPAEPIQPRKKTRPSHGSVANQEPKAAELNCEAVSQTNVIVSTHEPARLRQSEAVEAPVRRTRPRATVINRFKGFDDGFDDTINTVSSSQVQDYRLENVLHGVISQQDSNIRDSSVNSEMDEEPQNASQVQGRGSMQTPHNPRKRPSPLSEEGMNDEMVENLLPAAAAMKRRKIEQEQEAERIGKTVDRSFSKSQKTELLEKKIVPPKKEINIQEVVRERREAEEEAARRDEESLRGALGEEEIAQLRNLAVVEEMELPERIERPQRKDTSNQISSRWEQRWNGRKNFKKFRRHGEGVHARRGQSVIVPLEEVRKKDFGIGESYWLEPDSSKAKKKKRDKERTTQTQSQATPVAKNQFVEDLEVPKELAGLEGPETIDVDAPRVTRHMDHSTQARESGGKTRTINTKRQAVDEGRGVAKKQKTFAVRDESSDSDDELKFRFKKKR